MGLFKAVVDWTASLAMIVIAVWMVSGWRRPAPRVVSVPTTSALPSEPTSIVDSARVGSVKAPVAVIVYSDFQCPFSQAFAEKTWPEFHRRYVQTGKVLFVFRHLPLPIHADAMNAAVGAQCANQQGRFPSMHDRLFSKPQRLTPQAIREGAVELGMDVGAFDECVAGPGASVVTRQMEQAAKWGIAGTPTFLIGRMDEDSKVHLVARLDGLMPLERFASVLKERFGL